MMADSFDPYHQWLGIAPAHQPPNHYHLLGIPQFESDKDVISNAADRQMAHVRTFQNGPHAELSQKILSEISAARLCLLNAHHKADYDETLRGARPVPLDTNEDESFWEIPTEADPTPKIALATSATRRRRRRKKAPTKATISALLLSATIIGLLILVWPRQPESTSSSDNGTSAEQADVSPPDRPTSLPTPPTQIPPDSDPPEPTSSGPATKETTPPPPATAQHDNPPDEQVTAQLVARLERPYDVYSLAFGPDGKTLASADREAIVQLWDVETRQPLRELIGHHGWFSVVRISPDGGTLIAGGGKGTEVSFWDLNSEGERKSPDWGHSGWVVDLEFYPDGKTFASASTDNTIKLWDTATRQVRHTLEGHTGAVIVLALSPDARVLASGSMDKTIKLWNAETGALLDTYTGHTDTVDGLAYSPDGKILASGSHDHTIKLWSGRRLLSTWTGHEDNVYALAFSADGHTLVSGSSDQTLRLWDPETGEQRAVLREHAATISSIAFSPDGKLLAVGGGKLITLWNADLLLSRALEPSPVEAATTEPAAAPPVPRKPIPTEDAQRQALEKIKRQYQEQWSSAMSDEAKRSLAKLLLSDAEQRNDDADAKFALLVEARRFAIEAKDRRLAALAVIAVIRAYEVDELDWKLQYLLDTADSAKRTEDKQELGIIALELADAALAADRLDVAAPAAQLGQRMLLRTRVTDLRKWAMVTTKNVAARQEVAAARRTLTEDPDDAEANLLVGKHLCLEVRDWEGGLPLLAKTGDKKLQGAARLDLANPTDTTGQVEVGDAWYEIFRSTESFGVRARHWYTLALADSSGLARERLEKRIQLLPEVAAFDASASPDLVPQVDLIPTAENPPELHEPPRTVQLVRPSSVRVTAKLRARKELGDKGCHLAFSPNGRLLAGAHQSGTVVIWDMKSGQTMRELRGHHGFLSTVRFSPDGRMVAAGGGHSSEIRIWDVDSGEETMSLSGHSGWVQCLAYFPDGKTLASASQDRTITLWRTADGDLQNTLEGHSGAVIYLAISPDAKTLASGSTDRSIKIWNAEDGRLLDTLTGHEDTIASLAFSPDGKLLASGSYDHTVKLWRNRSLVRTLTEHTETVYSVAFSPDGATLISGSRDQTVRLWNPDTGKLRAVLPDHAKIANSIAISPDGKLLGAGGERFLTLWDIDTVPLRGRDES